LRYALPGRTGCWRGLKNRGSSDRFDTRHASRRGEPNRQARKFKGKTTYFIHTAKRGDKRTRALLERKWGGAKISSGLEGITKNEKLSVSGDTKRAGFATPGGLVRWVYRKRFTVKSVGPERRARGTCSERWGQA